MAQETLCVKLVEHSKVITLAGEQSENFRYMCDGSSNDVEAPEPPDFGHSTDLAGCLRLQGQRAAVQGASQEITGGEACGADELDHRGE